MEISVFMQESIYRVIYHMHIEMRRSLDLLLIVIS